MQCSEEADSPHTERRSRTSNACVQCQRKKKRCDGGMPQCTSCTERQLECTYLGVRRRGRGKAKVYLEKLEAIVGELETSFRGNSTSDPVESVNNNSSSVETHADEAQSSSSLPDALPLFGPGAKNPPELHPGSVDHDKAQSAVRERLITALHEQTSPEKPWMAPKKGPFTSSIFIQLPPKPYLQFLFEVTFVEPYPMVPVFDLHVLLRLLDQHYSDSPTFSLENYPQRWAMLNTAVAIGIQLQAAKGSETEMMAMSWPFFKNAFGMYVPITLRGVDILALEALLVMVAYMQGSSDLRTTSVLVSSAARLALTLGLHRETYYSGLDLGAANCARRAFWTCFVLDRDMSTRTGMHSNFDEEAISVDNLDLIQAEPAASSAETNAMSSSAASTLFLQSRVKLAILRSTVDKLLFSKYASEQSAPQLLSIVAELEHQLINWKAHLPSTLRPDHINPPTTTMGRQPILLMHMAYYSTLSEIHGFAAHLGSKGDNSSSIMWQVSTARIAQVAAAVEIIRLLQFVSREEQPGHLWCVYLADLSRVSCSSNGFILRNLLLYPMAACIMLVSIVLEGPTDTQACSCAQHIDDIVAFLRGLQHDRVLDVQGLLDLCGAFETLVREAISGAVDRTASSGPLRNGINPGLDARRQVCCES
ncbi:hypothetical protein ASPCAL00605 [Aspergillus calidoustus]|uniref:Zn(2)-C6 fungal-type domain-containing protein n=1 Tax=Aspergillus calidoustus TaxID=454130 RepID=A0A0U4YVT3_ASPCI|nr:hypothetical protein ASPCAL00605 [Aspergillus calidoustus]